MRAARKRGKHLGRPVKLSHEQISHAAGMIKEERETVSGMAGLLKVDRTTLHRALKRRTTNDKPTYSCADDNSSSRNV
jgi:DNA invertase Pin-like site-specific DNA recombinase